MLALDTSFAIRTIQVSLHIIGKIMSGVKVKDLAGSSANQNGSSLHKAQEDGVLVYTVNEVYIYIPTELSAAGFELKIAGSVTIKDIHKVGVVCIN